MTKYAGRSRAKGKVGTAKGCCQDLLAKCRVGEAGGGWGGGGAGRVQGLGLEHE